MEGSFDVILDKKEKTQFRIPGILTDKKDFEGPLDVLLFLIQENNANIYDLPIALITDQFLLFIKENETELSDLSDFYRTAAELLYIKTKLLLPSTTELDEEYEDPRQDLVDRLLDYQKFKKYTDLLSGADDGDRLYISRPDNYFAIPFEDKELFDGVTLNDLFNTFKDILGKIPPAKIFNIYEEVSIKEKKALMFELLDMKNRIELQDLILDIENPLHVICAFMAILESVKENTILFSQDEQYGPIFIEKRPIDWDPKQADSYDKEAEKYEKYGLADAEDFTILSKEASMDLDWLIEEKRANEAKEEEIESEIYLGEEEEVSLED